MRCVFCDREATHYVQTGYVRKAECEQHAYASPASRERQVLSIEEETIRELEALGRQADRFLSEARRSR